MGTSLRAGDALSLSLYQVPLLGLASHGDCVNVFPIERRGLVMMRREEEMRQENTTKLHKSYLLYVTNFHNRWDFGLAYNDIKYSVMLLQS